MAFFDDLLGGGGDDTAKDQAERTSADRLFTEEQIGGARRDIMPLFDSSAQSRERSAQSALDILGSALPAQLDVFQQGNVGAQQALLGGNFAPQSLNIQPQFQQALQQAQTLPQFTSPTQAIEQGEAQRRSSLLGGFNTDLDLFRAAGSGQIPGLSRADQNFFTAHAQNVARDAPQAAGFINNPQDRGFLGQQGGFDTQNELRLANLLDQIT